MADTAFASLVTKRLTKSVDFMGDKVKISKLTVSQVLEIQAAADESKGDSTSTLDLLRRVIKMSVEGAAELDDESFKNFPMDELSKLSSEILKYSGMTSETGK